MLAPMQYNILTRLRKTFKKRGMINMAEKWYRGNFEFPTGDSSSPLGSNKYDARKKFYKELTDYVEGEERFGKLYGASFIEYTLREGETLAEPKVLEKLGDI